MPEGIIVGIIKIGPGWDPGIMEGITQGIMLGITVGIMEALWRHYAGVIESTMVGITKAL